MSSGPLVNNFEVPSWAGKPIPGLHLDVLKDGKLIQVAHLPGITQVRVHVGDISIMCNTMGIMSHGQAKRGLIHLGDALYKKLMIDEKKSYFFGRNKQMCDFCIDHASCSRVHAALVWHKHLARPFLIDLGSTHGTFIGHIRLESKKPQQVPIDSEIHFGASTRIYIIRERPQPKPQGDDETVGEKEGNLLGLPESETELDNLTEFNTAHNRRSVTVSEIKDVKNPVKRKIKNLRISFHDEDEIINPEDIDPSIGRFRNLVQTHVIATKRPKLDPGLDQSSMTDKITKRLQSFSYSPGLYDMPGAGLSAASSFSMAAKLGVPLPNLAPNVDEDLVVPTINPTPNLNMTVEEVAKEPKKKKYAKEAWPGKKPVHSLLV